MIELLFIVQLGFIWFAYFSGPEEVHFTYPFRELNESQFPIATKTLHSKKAHSAGARGVLSLLLMIGAIFAIIQPGNTWMKIFGTTIAAGCCGLLYWLVFDIRYATGIGKPWDYLGDTTGTDNRVVRIFGKKAGRKKALLCIVLTIALNILYALLLPTDL